MARPCGITITFMGYYVEKRVDFDEENARKFLNRKHLERLYREVLPPDHTVPNTIQVDAVRFKSGTMNVMELKLSPFGEHVERPGQRLELAVALPALRDVLRSLQAIHAKGWCHRDVRWANIMRRHRIYPVSYMMIDFEMAAPFGELVTWLGVDSCHPPETRLDRGELRVGWKPKHDLWQVANLALRLDPTEEALDFMNKVVSDKIDSAEAAQGHPLFAAEESTLLSLNSATLFDASRSTPRCELPPPGLPL
jgi:serine/threonine protein kinase